MITDDQLRNWFSYHPPTESIDPAAVSASYDRIRAAGLAFARVLVEETPPCADQSAAIRHAREAVFNANAAIACRGM